MKYFFTNWKMYLTVADSVTLASRLASFKLPREFTAAVFPNTLAFTGVASALHGSGWQLGAQNVAWTPQGAYTGATSALMFKDVGARYALVGHSERRYVFGESDEDVRKKIEACLAVGLIPVISIGETAEDKRENKRQYRLQKQLSKAFSGLTFEHESVMVAYEPIWAVSRGGVGEPCSPADADDVAGWIKLELKNYTDRIVPMLYGGSVTAATASDYVRMDSVDGILVGSASTKPDQVAAMLASL